MIYAYRIKIGEASPVAAAPIVGQYYCHVTGLQGFPQDGNIAQYVLNDGHYGWHDDDGYEVSMCADEGDSSTEYLRLL